MYHFGKEVARLDKTVLECLPWVESSVLIEDFLEARVGIEADDGTGAIEFIGFNFQQNQQKQQILQSQAQFWHNFSACFLVSVSVRSIKN